jgi:transcriptional regulator with XRE-family HTH domain
MDAATAIREARTEAKLTQSALALRAGTSQATLSAYEGGRKQPSAATLSRLLAAAGRRLSTEPAERPVVQVTEAELARRGRTLIDVLGLADVLPSRHSPELRFPPLVALRDRSA